MYECRKLLVKWKDAEIRNANKSTSNYLLFRLTKKEETQQTKTK